MPKTFIAILLMLSLSYQCFVKLGIVIWYECNRDYVAKTLCENRDKPERKCCGKCYLRKQLKKADTGSTKNSSIPEKWNMGEVMVYVAPAIINISFVATATDAAIPLLNERYITHQPLSNIFHPPLV